MMLCVVALLAIFTVPYSISHIQHGGGYLYHHFTYVLMHTSWNVTGPLVIVCGIALLVDVIHTAATVER
jgi:hypothetical protein